MSVFIETLKITTKMIKIGLEQGTFTMVRKKCADRIPILIGKMHFYVTPYDLAELAKLREEAKSRLVSEDSLLGLPTSCSLEIYSPFEYAQGNIKAGIAELYIK